MRFAIHGSIQPSVVSSDVPEGTTFHLPMSWILQGLPTMIVIIGLVLGFNAIIETRTHYRTIALLIGLTLLLMSVLWRLIAVANFTVAVVNDGLIYKSGFFWQRRRLIRWDELRLVLPYRTLSSRWLGTTGLAVVTTISDPVMERYYWWGDRHDSGNRRADWPKFTFGRLVIPGLRRSDAERLLDLLRGHVKQPEQDVEPNETPRPILR